MAIIVGGACSDSNKSARPPSSRAASTTRSTSLQNGPQLPRAVKAWLVQYAAQGSYGKATSADWVLTTHGKAAVIVSGAEPGDATLVYLFDVHGNFDWNHSCPPGAPPSACRSVGAHEVFTLDPQRLQVLDFTVAQETPNLAQFGVVGHVTL